MTKEQMLRLSGLKLFECQIKAFRQGKITLRQVRFISEAWLRHRGYIPTSLGWWKPEELEQMGAIQLESGEWVIGVEERQRVTGRGKEQSVQLYHVAAQANDFFVRRQQANAHFAGLAQVPVMADGSSNATNSTADNLLTVARSLFNT